MFWSLNGLLVMLAAVLQLLVAPALAERQVIQCDTEMQIVMCGQIPFGKFKQRRECCYMYKPLPPGTEAAAIAAALATAAAVASQLGSSDDGQSTSGEAVVPRQLPFRPDLDVNGTLWQQQPNYYLSNCTAELLVEVPTFHKVIIEGQGSNGSSSASQTPTVTTASEVILRSVPALSKSQIVKVKAQALASLPSAVQQKHDKLYSIHPDSGFIHPGGYAGPAELALMQHRLQTAHPTQTTALTSLLTGAGVPPKVYGGGWFPPTDCLPEYAGPYPMPAFAAKWGGTNNNAGSCAANYPPGAPQSNCGHVSFVELDAQMSYRQALAFVATGDERYAETALRIVDGWAAVNRQWGLQNENGPLEAGWGCASMSRALELLRHTNWSGFKYETYQKYVDWVDYILMPQMDTYVYKMSQVWAAQGAQHVYGNWHSSIADCYVSFGLLTDNVDRYQKGVELYHTTVQDYLKWGRGEYKTGRIVGEASETMRDIYHTEFGLGGLVQVAEQAWQQNDDVYGSNHHALAAALELHARIINANAENDSSQLPPGFKWFRDMPAPPAGSSWRFNIRTQRWFAQDQATGTVVSTLEDGVRYMVGVSHLPTGWEVAYNHYQGRLGMQMPETAKLLARVWPDWHVFHWGLGTLTHADTAAELWRPGVDSSTVCGDSIDR